MADGAPLTEGVQIEMAGNSPCPVCGDEGMVQIGFANLGTLAWDACWFCAWKAEMEWKMEGGR